MARNRGRGLLLAVPLVLLGLGVLGWSFRDRLWGMWQGGTEVTEVSEEAAVQAEAKLQRLRESGEPVELNSTELSSLLRYRAPQWASGSVSDPAVALAGDTVRVTGVVPTENLPSHPELDQIRPILPDSSRFEIVAHVRPMGEGRAALEVSEVEFAGIPIPSRYYPGVLERIGRRDEPGLPRNALSLKLPAGVGSARVEGGRLILSP